MIFVLNTASENVFVGLWDDGKSFWSEKQEFAGGRELNSLIMKKLNKTFKTKLTGIIIAAGPGSFTGLRIGMSVANTLAYTNDIPIVAPKETEDTEELLHKGISMLNSAGSQFTSVVTPHYGSDPHITKPKH